MDELKAGGFRISQGALGMLRAPLPRGAVRRTRRGPRSAALFRTTGEVLCPHSAVGVKVAEAHLGATPMITLATAHPAKFPDAVAAAMGVRPALPPRMADLFDRKERVTRQPNDLKSLQSLVRERIARS